MTTTSYTRDPERDKAILEVAHTALQKYQPLLAPEWHIALRVGPTESEREPNVPAQVEGAPQNQRAVFTFHPAANIKSVGWSVVHELGHLAGADPWIYAHGWLRARVRPRELSALMEWLSVLEDRLIERWTGALLGAHLYPPQELLEDLPDLAEADRYYTYHHA